ncbi:hypothetical protein GCM10023107_73880 [Actinoplanes octamycinicus]|nr:hypothetical protein Aoc01nite_54410 [Actinoplanes octamycinicus]
MAPLVAVAPSAAAADPAPTVLEQLRQRVQDRAAPRFDGTVRLPDPAPQQAPAARPAAKSAAADGCQPAGSAYLLCDQPGTEHPDPARLRTSGRSTLAVDPIPLPEWCYEYAYRGWQYYRQDGCAIQSRTATIVDRNTREPVGAINYLLAENVFTADDIPNFGRQAFISPFGGWGLGLSPGTTVVGELTCSGACLSLPIPFGPQPATQESVVKAIGIFPIRTLAAGAVDYANSRVTYTFLNPLWEPTPITPDPAPPQIRCDNAVPGYAYVGCVFPGFAPIYQYARSGLYPELAEHIGDAQGSGLPGAPGTPALHRMVDPARQDANGNRACPRRYPRPATKSCDEYPFRSTIEGASTAVPQGVARTFNWCTIPEPIGTTGPTGYSVCMIDARQNSNGGSALNTGLYQSERVIDGDAFYIEIVGTGGGTSPFPPDYPPSVNAGPDVSGYEGDSIELAGTATDDNGTPTVTWSYAAGPDVDPGATCTFSGGGSTATTAIRCTDDGTYTVTIHGDDGIHDEASTDSATVRMVNVDPRIRRNTRDLNAAADVPALGIVSPRPWQVYQVGDPVTLTTNFEDPGSNDTHTCTIGWDDGTTSNTVADGHVCGGAHTYQHAGMYTITPGITDDDGGTAEQTSVLIIVYDPDGGFATGAGHFTSAAGSLPANPTATGKTHFQFNPKYLPHDTGPVPSNGKANLKLEGGAFDFTSTSLSWLVVTQDGKTAVSGTGSVNGKAGYGFVAYGYETGHFRMVVWDLAKGAYPTTDKIYDNSPSLEYDLDRARLQPIDAGSIHTH